jgi:hypothetical protein
MASGTAFDADTPQDDPTPWGRHVIWGNQLVGGDALAAVTFASDVAWGATAVAGTNVVTSTDVGGVVSATDCSADLDCDNIVWGTNVLDAGEDVVWSPAIRRERVTATDDPAGGQA